MSAVLGQDVWGKLSQQRRQEGDLAEKRGEWIVLVLALVSLQICLISEVGKKRPFANSGEVIYNLSVLKDQLYNLWGLVQIGNAGPLFVDY